MCMRVCYLDSHEAGLCCYLVIYIKGKATSVRGRETSGIPPFLDNRLTDGGEVVQPYALAALYSPGRFLVFVSIRGWVDPRVIMRLEGLGKLKNAITSSSGLEPAIFRLVA
jgi:hypothetical protein